MLRIPRASSKWSPPDDGVPRDVVSRDAVQRDAVRVLRRRPVALAYVRHGAADRPIADPGTAETPALRPDGRAARSPRLPPRARRRHRAAEHGRDHLPRPATDDGVPGLELPALPHRYDRVRSPRRGRLDPAGPRRAAVRGPAAAADVPATGQRDGGRQVDPAVRRPGELGERLEPAVPPARRSPRPSDPAAMTKVVAVSATRRTDGGRERVALNAAYVQALTRAGLVPVIVAPILDPETACAVLDRVQGLVLTGGEDVEPARYHAPPHPKLGETDAGRDAVEVALIAGARARRLPTLAICRGIQILNVALGGTLYQDLASERRGPIDHADARACHGLSVEAGSRLHGTINAEQVTVNSRHHQAIRDLAPALRATAWAEDGVIEGVEPKDPTEPWTLAVQWHPEDDVEGALFAGFAGAVA